MSAVPAMRCGPWPWATGHGPWAVSRGPWAVGPGSWVVGRRTWTGPWVRGSWTVSPESPTGESRGQSVLVSESGGR